MARFPRIQSPCPYKGELSAIMDGDQCRLCKRTVVDLTVLDEARKATLLAGCSAPVCVTYRLPAAIAAGVVAAAAFALPAAADPVPEVTIYDGIVVVGGIADFQNIAYIETTEDLAVPDLPVVYEGSAEPDGVK